MKSPDTLLKATLAHYKEVIDQALDQSVKEIGDSSPVVDACRHALLSGGKRIRPAIVLTVADALGHGLSALPAALCVEFHHASSLIADDLPCMDDDDERRGQPTCHKLYGETNALLASYALIAAGYEQLARNATLLSKAASPFASQAGEACRLALEKVSRGTGLHGIIGGQFLDLHATEPSEKLLRKIHTLKTGALFEVSFVLGWLFGGGSLDQAHLRQVERMAHHFGTLFQLVDDLLDVPQDREAEHPINSALVLGIDATLEWMEREAEAFESCLEQLQLPSGELQELACGLRQMGAEQSQKLISIL